MKRKKPNRAARMEKKLFHANTFNTAFNQGYTIGYEQAIRDMKKQQDDEAGIGQRFYKLD